LNLAWDGDYIYAYFGKDVRRWSPEGVADDWIIDIDDVRDLEIADGVIGMIGSFVAQQGDPMYEDAFVTAYATSNPPQALWGQVIGLPEQNDGGIIMKPGLLGGWVAAGSLGAVDTDRLWLRGFAGANLDVSFDYYARVSAIVGHQNAVIAVGDRSGPWLASVSSSGEILWVREHSMCGGEAPNGSVNAVAANEDRLRALVTVQTGEKAFREILAAFDFEGELLGTTALAIESQRISIPTMVEGDAGTYVGGLINEDGVTYKRFVALLEQ
jgi:hypothetical protein